jgi:hypothetical protein
MKMKQITFILPYYRNPNMLQKQFEFWNQYSEETRRHLQIIVVDDGSPLGSRAQEVISAQGLAVDVLDFRLYRILTDLRWNCLQGRNLGASEATTPWLLLTDMDHVVLPEVMESLMREDHDVRVWYMFSRGRWPEMTPRNPHPNSFLMSKEFFWRVGGEDETYAGHYGTDRMWKERCRRVGEMVLLPHKLASGFRKYVPDASTTTLERRENQDKGDLEEITAYKQRHGVGVQTLRLPWVRVI